MGHYIKKKIISIFAVISIFNLHAMDHAAHAAHTASIALPSQEIHKNHLIPKKDQDPIKSMRLSYAWQNPKIKPSPPPPLMGKQMGIINTLSIPSLGYEMDGNVKVFRLIAQPVEITIVDEKKEADYEHLIPTKNQRLDVMMDHKPIIQKLHAWGYNGVTPGPTIEVNEGDRIRIIVTNELPEPTAIHWHGIELPNNQDGAAGFAEPPLMPGATKTYEFTLYQSGTYFYHGEFNLMKASSYGLTGALVVHPKKYEDKIDKQFVITMQEWRVLPGNVDPDLVSMDFNWFTFNGHSAPNIPAMTVNQGDRVRIRLINMSMNNHPIHMHGHTWWVVGTEGGPIPKSAQWPGNTVDVAPGTSRDVEFVAWNPGMWFFHCHKLHHVMNAHADVPLGIMHHGGMFTIVHVIPKDPQAPWKHPKEKDHVHKNHETKGDIMQKPSKGY